MDRRQFLKTNGVLAAGMLALPTMIPSSALGLDGVVAPLTDARRRALGSPLPAGHPASMYGRAGGLTQLKQLDPLPGSSLERGIYLGTKWGDGRFFR